MKVCNSDYNTNNSNIIKENLSSLSCGSCSLSSPAAKNLKLSLSTCKDNNTSTKVHNVNKVFDIESRHDNHFEVKVDSVENDIKVQHDFSKVMKLETNYYKSDEKDTEVN